MVPVKWVPGLWTISVRHDVGSLENTCSGGKMSGSRISLQCPCCFSSLRKGVPSSFFNKFTPVTAGVNLYKGHVDSASHPWKYEYGLGWMLIFLLLLFERTEGS